MPVRQIHQAIFIIFITNFALKIVVVLLYRMDNNLRLCYETPAVRVLEFRQEGVVCQSSGKVGSRNDYDIDPNNPFGVLIP